MKRIGLLSAILLAAFLFAALSANADEEYWGSKKSDKYHYTTCTWAKKIKDENRIVFHSVNEAKEAGYEPCKVCKPPED